MRRAALYVLLLSSLATLTLLLSSTRSSAPRGTRDPESPAQLPPPANENLAPPGNAEEYLDLAELFTGTSNDRTPNNPTKALPPLTCLPISGRVFDDAGRGVGGLTVFLKAEKESDARPKWREYHPMLRRAGLRTAEDGSYHFPQVPEGSYTVVVGVFDPKYVGRVERKGVVAGSAPVDFHLSYRPVSVPKDIYLQVLLPDGSPLPSGRADLFSGGLEGRIKDGRCCVQLIHRPAPGASEVKVLIYDLTDAEGRAIPVSQKCVSVPIEEGPHVVQLDVGLRLAGCVTCDGKPVSTVVELQARNFRITTVRSDKNGRFEFRALPDRDFSLHIDTQGRAYQLPAPLRVRAGRDDVQVRAVRSVIVTGRLLAPEGKRLGTAFARVYLFLWPGFYATWGAHRCANGQFEIGGLFPGTRCEFQIWGTYEDGTAIPWKAVPFTAGGGPLNVPLESGREIAGVVMGPDGQPLTAAKVRVYLAEALRWRHGGEGDYAYPYDLQSAATTNSHGRFRITGVRNERVLLQARSGDLWSCLTPVPQTTSAVRLVTGARASIRGRIEGDDNSYKVSAWQVMKAGQPVFAQSDYANDDGTFQLKQLEPATYLLYAWGSESCAVAWRVEVGNHDVHLKAERAHRIAGIARSSDGSPCRGAEVLVTGVWGARGMRVDRAGRFAFEGVPHGQCFLEARRQMKFTHSAKSSVATVTAGDTHLEVVVND